MKKTIASILASAMLLALCLTGCGEAPATTSSAPAEPASAPQSTFVEQTGTHTVTDVMGREIEVADDIQRVVTTFNLEEYFAVTGAEGIDKLVGFSHAYWEGRRQDAWDAWTSVYPQLAEIDDVGYNDSISVEKIISLDPDLLIMSQAVNYDFIEPHLQKLQDAGIPVLFVNYHKQTPEMHKASTIALGQAFGKEDTAQQICDYYDEQMNLITEKIASIPEGTELPKVYMEFSRGINEYGSSWGKKMWGALIETCGGENVAKDFGEGNSVDVNPELVIAANPDVIIFAASPQKDMDNNVVLGYGADEAKAQEAIAAYKDRDGWANLNAVKNENMHAVYHDLSRHIFDFAGAQALAKAIHPELFEDLDPQENLKVFFERFMPVELTGTWMTSLD